MVNKNNLKLLGINLLLLLFIAVPVYAQLLPPPPNDFVGPPSPPPSLVPCGQTLIENGKSVIRYPCGYNDFLELIKRIFDYLVIFAVPLAAGVIAVGGAVMMTAGTNDSKRSQAKKIIWMAIWGLVVVLASYLIVKLVFTTLVKTKVIPDNFK